MAIKMNVVGGAIRQGDKIAPFVADKGDPGPRGAQGSSGTTGPAGASLIGALTIMQTAVVAIQAGVRSLSLTVQGVAQGDALSIIPTAPLPPGYAIHNIVATGPNAVQVTMTAPLLALGASYSIPCKVYRINV